MSEFTETEATIRILIVDDQRLFRQSLQLLLEQDPEIVVVGETGDGQEGVVLATEMNPDMVLLDVGLPGLPGPQVAQLIHERASQIKILMLSVHDDDERIRESLAAGAVGYILKDADYREFLRIIKKIIRNEPITSPFLMSPTPEKQSLILSLTAKERNVLRLLSEAKSNKEIARELGLSPETIKSHLQKIYVKLNVSSRTEAMRFFFEHIKKR